MVDKCVTASSLGSEELSSRSLKPQSYCIMPGRASGLKPHAAIPSKKMNKKNFDNHDSDGQ